MSPAPARALTTGLLVLGSVLAPPPGAAGAKKGPAVRPPAERLMAILPARSRTRWPAEAAALAARHGLVATLAWELKSLEEYCVVLDLPGGGNADLIGRRLARDPHVLFAQPVQRFHLLDEAKPAYDDPYVDLQAAVRSLRLQDVHRRTTGKGVRLALVDTGVDIDHPDLRGRIAGVGNFVEHGEATFTRDVHGTAVAGVVAAAANNGVGMVGVAPGAEIVALKACWYERGTGADGPPGQAACDSYTLAKAVDAALGETVRVLNLSLTGPPDPLLARLLEKALERGVTVVAAADPAIEGGGFPASLAGVLAVRAAGASERLRPGDGGGQAFVAAPGTDVLSTAPAGAYDFFTGSSFAAAHASGVVALLLELRPSLTPKEISALLRAYPGASGEGAGGALDACAALRELLATEVCAGS